MKHQATKFRPPLPPEWKPLNCGVVLEPLNCVSDESGWSCSTIKTHAGNSSRSTSNISTASYKTQTICQSLTAFKDNCFCPNLDSILVTPCEAVGTFTKSGRPWSGQKAKGHLAALHTIQHPNSMIYVIQVICIAGKPSWCMSLGLKLRMLFNSSTL